MKNLIKEYENSMYDEFEDDFKPIKMKNYRKPNWK